MNPFEPGSSGETPHIDTSKLRTRILALLDRCPKLAVAFLVVAGKAHGNLRELFDPLGLDIRKAWDEFETEACLPLRAALRHLSDDLAWWPAGSRVLWNECAIAARAALDALKDAFRRIARKDVEEELQVKGRLPTLPPASSPATTPVPPPTAESQAKHNEARDRRRALDPLLALAKAAVEIAEVAVKAASHALRKLRARVTGDPDGVIVRTSPATKLIVGLAVIVIAGFELVINAVTNGGTRFEGFVTALMAVIILNGLAVISAGLAKQLLGYARACRTYAARQASGMEDFGPPFTPDPGAYIVGVGGTIIVGAGCYALVAHRLDVIRQLEILSANRLAIVLTVFGVVLTWFLKLTLNSSYPQRYAEMEDRLITELTECELRLKEAQANLDKLTLQTAELDRDLTKLQEEHEQTFARAAADQQRAETLREREAAKLGTAAGREETFQQAIDIYKPAYTESWRPWHDTTGRLRGGIVLLNLLGEQYVAAFKDIVQPGGFKAASELITRIGSRDPNCGLRRLNDDPQAQLWWMEVLQDACRPSLTPLRDEFVVPAFRPSDNGGPELIDGKFTLAEAIHAFERCSVAVQPPVTSFQLLYEEIRAEVRKQVLREQALSAMVKEGVSAEEQEPPQLGPPQIGQGGPSRLDAPKTAEPPEAGGEKDSGSDDSKDDRRGEEDN